MSLGLVCIAIALAACSGVPGLFVARSPDRGQRIAALLVGAGALLGLAGAGAGLRAEAPVEAWFPWPAAGNSVVGIDALSAFFLVPVFLIGGLGPLFGLGYWPAQAHPESARRIGVFWGLLIAGLALLLVARHAGAFLMGWEAMALAAFFLIGAEDRREECRRAAWLYLVATHVGTLALFALFALWRSVTGSYALGPVPLDAIGLGMMNALFFLALLGFGLKAGMIPLHFWLPSAHASAPSHVSALLSGVVIKMGIYGLLRFLALLPAPPAAWGGLILLLGGVSGVLGVAWAIGQHDLKRLLAYHSVENIGIILMGLGLALLGRSSGRPEWIALGLAACLLHVWNHGLFKALLFLGAGSVVHAAHTREIERLGGLARRMPWTAATFLVGAAAICGLPPLNGFVSELLLYLGLLRPVVQEGAGTAVAVAAPVLALIGALALACFVKVYGVVFLGHPRGTAAATEVPAVMIGPQVALAACCAGIGLAPLLVVPVLDPVIATWAPELRAAPVPLRSLAPLGAMTVLGVVLAALIAAFALILTRCGRRTEGTWDCGYVQPTSRMQYGASSFSQMIVDLFGWLLRPRYRRPVLPGVFPAPASMHSHVDDLVLDRVLLPVARAVERWFGRFRYLQQGLTHRYLLYILIAVVAMMSTLLPVEEFLARWFAR